MLCTVFNGSKSNVNKNTLQGEWTTERASQRDKQRAASKRDKRRSSERVQENRVCFANATEEGGGGSME